MTLRDVQSGQLIRRADIQSIIEALKALQAVSTDPIKLPTVAEPAYLIITPTGFVALPVGTAAQIAHGGATGAGTTDTPADPSEDNYLFLPGGGGDPRWQHPRVVDHKQAHIEAIIQGNIYKRQQS